HYSVFPETRHFSAGVVHNKNAKKTSKKVAMGSTYTAKAVKKVHSTKIVRINKSQWLNTKDVVKD
ncbi:MAG: hypothetical protein L0I05_00910, partial [Lactobacillus sp.]|nr:hypothetical protein [Lactobacillus sp.]